MARVWPEFTLLKWRRQRSTPSMSFRGDISTLLSVLWKKNDAGQRFNMLDPKLERILNQLLESARLKRYEFISLEHVLLSLTSKDEETQEILEACGTDLKLL